MKTFPCIKGKIGDWPYYVTTMSMAELVNYVKFADEIFPRNDLDQIMQRELTNRSSAISDYLVKNEQRFMGSLVVAAVGGEPKFVPVGFGDDNIYSFADGKLGFLRFDGSENYYALDGQHRLAAIKDALKRLDTLGKDEVSLIIIWHADNEEGRKRARRLFTTVNRYVKKTTNEEDLVSDEDSPVNIYTRRLVREHPFFKVRTKVINLDNDGAFKLTKSQSLKPLDKYDGNFLFALLTLKRCNEMLLQRCFTDLKVQEHVLPDFEVVEEGYAILLQRWNILIENIPPWKWIADHPAERVDQYRKRDGGHPLVRPIAIIAFVDAAAKLLDENGPVENISKISGYFSDITTFPLLGLLWKEENGGMYDGQARRRVTTALFSYYLTGLPDKQAVADQWVATTGIQLTHELPERSTLLI